jgi:hypothetical protein
VKWDTDTTARLNLALDEAELIGAEVDSEECVAGLTLAVLSLPEEGPAPEDRRVQIILRPVGRVAASLRHGAWNDDSAEVEPFQVDALLSIVKRFGASAIYGGKFFDVPKDKDFRNWKDRLSLDWWAPDAEAGTAHTLYLFQEGEDLHLDMRLWFDELLVFRPPPGYEPIELDEFVAGADRWWKAFGEGDPRTSGLGIFRLSDFDFDGP